MNYYKEPTVKEIEIDIKKNRAKKEKQNAITQKTKGLNYFRKNEKNTDYNRKLAKFLKDEKG